MAHTPGPWNVCEADPLTVEPKTYGSHGEPICHALGKPVHRETAEAVENARLIAAAPELLEALQALIPVLDRLWEYDGDVMGILHNRAIDADDAARAAIAKATKGE